MSKHNLQNLMLRLEAVEDQSWQNVYDHRELIQEAIEKIISSQDAHLIALRMAALAALGYSLKRQLMAKIELDAIENNQHE